MPQRIFTAAMTKRFSDDTLAAFQTTKYLRIRSGDHRFILIWAVVVEGRVIVRSWNDKPKGWYRAFLAESTGHVWFDGKELPIRAVQLRSQRLNDATDDAYAAKYTAKGDVKFVEGFRVPRRKACTLELLPA